MSHAPDLSNLFYRRPRLLVLALALIVVSGLAALEVLPRAEDPELVSRNALVVTPYPGADADRVESRITEKLEEELEEIDEIQRLESTSRAGLSILAVELRDAVAADETDEIWSRVRDRLDDAAAEFPPGAGAPDFEELEIAAWSMHVALVWAGEGEPNLAILGRLAEELEDALRAVPGTQDTERFGAPTEEIRVDVEPERLATLGLTTTDLARALERGDAKVPAGRLDGTDSELLLEVEGELDGLERIARLPVRAARGAGDGTLVRLGEIARIDRAVADPPAELALVDGRPGVLVAVRMRNGDRIDRWAERAHAALADFEAGLPAGIALEVPFDQSTYTAQRLVGLFGNLVLGAGLVVLVILFAMGWRSALLVGSALPLSALMVLAGMRALGVPMHQMSITGLIIALGLLIDNAIVMVDEVGHELSNERDVARAIGAAVRRLAVPLLASTLTTVLAFLPLVLAPGPVGEFVGAMSLSVVLAVTSSFLLALTVVPALTGLLARSGAASEHGGLLTRGFSNARLTAAYRRGLERLFAHPVLALAIAAFLPVLGFWKGGSLQEQFFPPAGRDQAAIELVLADLSSIERTRAEVERADAILRAHPSVVATDWVLGRSAPKFYYNQIEQIEGAPSYAGGLIQLASAEDALGTIRELQAELDRALPAAQVLVRQLEQGPPFDAPVELILQGPDLDVLRERGEALRRTLAALPEVTHTRSSLDVGRPKLLFTPLEEEVELAGLDRVGLAERLQAALSGAIGGSVFEGEEELPVRVRVAAASRRDAEQVASLELSAPGASGSARADAAPSWIPLESLGTFELVPQPSRIPRRDGRRTNEVHAFVTAGVLPEDVLDPAREALADFDLPAGYTLTFAGEAAERDDAVGGLAASAGVLLVLMAATLVLAFQSFRLAGIVGAVAFLSVGLSLGALWLFGYPFGFMAIVGTMGLVGIAINDSIVVLSALREDPASRAGDPRAVAAVVVRATRHVLSTTVTTVAGFIPLLMQSEGLWPPLAVSIAGGVAGATLIALTLVPGAFVIATRRSARARGTERSPARPALVPAS